MSTRESACIFRVHAKCIWYLITFIAIQYSTCDLRLSPNSQPQAIKNKRKTAKHTRQTWHTLMFSTISIGHFKIYFFFISSIHSLTHKIQIILIVFFYSNFNPNCIQYTHGKNLKRNTSNWMKNNWALNRFLLSSSFSQ